MTDRAPDGMLGRPQRGPIQVVPVVNGHAPPNSDAPHSEPQRPLAHPGSIPTLTEQWDIPLPTGGSYEDAVRYGVRVTRAENRRLDKARSRQPRFHLLHDRLRTRDAWEKCVDGYSGILAPATPTVGGSTTTNIFKQTPLFPSGTDNMLMYLYVNEFNLGAQGTTLTGLVVAELVVNPNVSPSVIPLGILSGLGAMNESIGLLCTTPFSGDIDDKTPIAALRLTIPTGATVSAVTLQAQLTFSYVYRFIAEPHPKEPYVNTLSNEPADSQPAKEANVLG